MLPAGVSQLVVAEGHRARLPDRLHRAAPRGQQAASYYRNFFAALVVVGVIMVIINFALSSFATWLAQAAPQRRQKGDPPGRRAVDTDGLDGAPGIDEFSDTVKSQPRL